MTSRLGPVLLVTSFLLSMSLSNITPPTDAQSRYKDTFQLAPFSPSAYEVIVTPTNNGTANFLTTVQVGIFSNETYRVVLNATVSTGWETHVAPSTLVFSHSDEVSVSVTVVVPAATPSALIGKLTLTGNCSNSNGSLEVSTYAVITVGQYFRFDIYANYLVKSESRAIVDLIITNRGNGLDSYSIAITNLDELSAKNIIVTASTYELSSVAAGGNGTIRISIKYDGNELTLSEHVEVAIKSEAAATEGLAVIKTYPIFVQFETRSNIVTTWFIGGTVLACIIVMIVVVFLVLRDRNRRSTP